MLWHLPLYSANLYLFMFAKGVFFFPPYLLWYLKSVLVCIDLGIMVIVLALLHLVNPACSTHPFPPITIGRFNHPLKPLRSFQSILLCSRWVLCMGKHICSDKPDVILTFFSPSFYVEGRGLVLEVNNVVARRSWVVGKWVILYIGSK